MRKRSYALRILSLGFLLFASTQCKMDPGKFPVTAIGLGKDGKEFHHVLPGKHAKHLGNSLNDISEKSLEVLDDHWENSPWEFNRIDVGLALTFKLGFTVVNFEASPSFRVTFKKK